MCHFRNHRGSVFESCRGFTGFRKAGRLPSWGKFCGIAATNQSLLTDRVAHTVSGKTAANLLLM